jgi:hypothetical protein
LIELDARAYLKNKGVVEEVDPEAKSFVQKTIPNKN